MLKQAVFSAASAAVRVTGRKKGVANHDFSREDVEQVIKLNPDFLRLDGILTSLAEACLHPRAGNGARVLGVCSAVRGEGKTTVALGLATALARRAASDVLLMEGDLANPTLAELLPDVSSVGLAECLRSEGALDAAVQPTPVPHLSVMAAGQGTDAPFTVLGEQNLRLLFGLLKERFRYVLLDMPAILEREEAGRLVELVDGVILVIGAGSASREVTEAGVAAIGKDKLTGIVLNRVSSAAPSWLSRMISTDGAQPTS